VLYGVVSGPELYHRSPNDEIFNVTVFFPAVNVRGKPVSDSIESARLEFFGFDALPTSVNACISEREASSDF
jgi:hypothetical protein